MFSLCPVVPLSVPAMFRANIRIIASLRANTEWNSMKFSGGNQYHSQVNLLNFGRNWTRDKRPGYDRKFESTSNRCCQAASARGITWLPAKLYSEERHFIKLFSSTSLFVVMNCLSNLSLLFHVGYYFFLVSLIQKSFHFADDDKHRQ